MTVKMLFFLMLGAAASRDSVATKSRLAADLEQLDTYTDKEFKERPIMRVVGLLQDMKKELEEEAANDQVLYDKLVCWCETNDKEKTKAIADGNTAIDELSAKIEENTALASTREVEIGALKKEVAELTEALAKAEELRTKEKAEFNEQEKDFIESIQSLGAALSTLGKVQGGSSLIQRQNALVKAQSLLQLHESKAMTAVAPHHRAELRTFLHGSSKDLSLLDISSVTAKGKGKAPEYAPASGMIFGILGQMKETFETNMENGKKEEAQGASDYQALKATKSEQLKAASDKLYQYTQDLAKAKETAANSKEDLEDTTQTVYSETEFLTKL